MDWSALPALAPRLLAMALLLFGSAFFSGSETSLFSLSRLTRERLARSERSIDRYIVAILREPRRLIVTVLLGNELINVTFSSLAAGVVERLFGKLGSLGVTMLTTGLTVPLILLLGEITPKSIALATAEGWARVCARPIGFFAFLMTPIRVLVNGIAGVIVRLLGGGAQAPREKAIGEAEFRALVDVGSEEGELEAAERRLIHNVFRFGDRTVAEIMTPARKVFALSYDLPFPRLAAEVVRGRFSRIPIYKGKRENVVGILFSKDLVGMGAKPVATRTIKDLLKQPTYVPKTTKCDRLFREFQKKKTHLAMVVDEYGRLVGLVTMEDLLEELFGEIRDEKEKERRGGNAAAVGTAAGGPAAGMTTEEFQKLAMDDLRPPEGNAGDIMATEGRITPLPGAPPAEGRLTPVPGAPLMPGVPPVDGPLKPLLDPGPEDPPNGEENARGGDGRDGGHDDESGGAS